jgi:hypothetical protein
MAIEPLLWFCMNEHVTSYEERGLSVSIARQRDETILRFRTDREADGKTMTPFRAHFLKRDGSQKASDVLYFYKYADKQPILIFGELKSRFYFNEAIEQLENTIGAVKPKIDSIVGKESTQYLALIVLDGGGRPSRNKRQQIRVEGSGVDLCVKAMPRGKAAIDLRAVLRKWVAPFVAP